MKFLEYFCLSVIVLHLLFHGCSLAQETKNNFLGANFGISNYHIRDDHASPLFFRGTGIAPSLQYLYKSETEQHAVKLSYLYGYLGSNNSNFNTDNWRAEVKYSYVHSITSITLFTKNVGLFLGVSASTFLSLSDYHFIDDQHLAIKSWYWNNSVNVEFLMECALRKSEFISLQLSLPVISNISRPDYSPSKNYSYATNTYIIDAFGEMEIFPKNIFLNAVLTYQKPIGESINLQIEYEFYYSLYNKPKEIAMYMNNIRAGLFFNL